MDTFFNLMQCIDTSFIFQTASERIAGKRGRPRTHSRREIVNAILYIVTAGCVWRLLPHDLPPWKTVYDYFGHVLNLCLSIYSHFIKCNKTIAI
jgi:transposase